MDNPNVYIKEQIRKLLDGIDSMSHKEVIFEIRRILSYSEEIEK